ncbi:MAG: MBOAT family O-acyltransferase [Anaerolineaceae bacterium]
MTLFHICVFLFISLFTGIFVSKKNRSWLFVIFNILAVFWLQPVSSIRHLDFWLPATSVGLVVLTWFSTQSTYNRRKTWLTVGVISITFLAISLLRYIEPLCCITASRPPAIFQILVVVVPLILFFILVIRFFPKKPALSIILICAIIVLFIILKTEIFSAYFSKAFRSITGQDPTLAAASDLLWIGFSYLAFRLLHYLRDFQTGKIPSHNLDEFIAYTLFYPSYTAGPIERLPRFLENMRAPEDNLNKRWHLSSKDFFEGSTRVIMGIFKKFVLADSLAIIALNNQNALQIKSTFWAWVILYSYALRIYFDFSGYTDVAIGMGRYLGIRLPENFTSPYLKNNLTSFWNSWHITLAQWFRAYVFNPLTRSMRSSNHNFYTWFIILCAQLSTMFLIGLWHGITINFAIWGLWHGLGLFIHNRWSDWRKTHFFEWENKSWVKNLFSCGSWLITFNYVSLGWVWFALSTPQMSWHIIRVLLGVNI